MTTQPNSAYFIRVQSANALAFENYLHHHNIECKLLSTDMSKGTNLFSVIMDSETALSLRLAFPIIGCINFTRTLGTTIKE